MTIYHVRILALVVILIAIAPGVLLHAQQEPTPTAVTLETREGDTIEGELVSANGTEVVVRVAGQPLTLAIDVLRYISFDGRIEASPDAGGERKLRAVIVALSILKGQVEELENEDHASFVISFNAALPAVTLFLSSPGASNWICRTANGDTLRLT